MYSWTGAVEGKAETWLGWLARGIVVAVAEGDTWLAGEVLRWWC